VSILAFGGPRRGYTPKVNSELTIVGLLEEHCEEYAETQAHDVRALVISDLRARTSYGGQIRGSAESGAVMGALKGAGGALAGLGVPGGLAGAAVGAVIGLTSAVHIAILTAPVRGPLLFGLGMAILDGLMPAVQRAYFAECMGVSLAP
jgi:hypothetical protein